jgi:uncharacterized membrane protein
MHLPQWVWECAKLSGVLIVLVGLALRLKPTLVVVAAALVTGVVAGIPLFSDRAIPHNLPGFAILSIPGREGLIDMLGRAFAENRLMTLFIITLPAIGLSERFGLQRQAARVIQGFRLATVGRLLIVYQMFRVFMGMLGLRVNGHPTFVRPLVYPMLLGAEQGSEREQVGALPEARIEQIKAAAAASENYGNFYGQNLSPVQPGILLVYAVLKGLGYTVSVWRLVLYAIPIAVLTVILGAVQFRILGRRGVSMPVIQIARRER